MICDRSGQALVPQASTETYSVWIWVVADIPEEIDKMRCGDIENMIEDETRRRGTLPAYLIASEIYGRRRYRICSRCKKLFLANPLNMGS